MGRPYKKEGGLIPMQAEKINLGKSSGTLAPEAPTQAPPKFNWDQVEEAVKRTQATAGVYTLRCSEKSIYKPTKAGRPAINFLLTIDEDPKADGIFMMAVLPWNVTAEALEHEAYAKKKEAGLKVGDYEDSGLFVLDGLAKAFKFKGSGEIDIPTMIRFFHNKAAKARLKLVPITMGTRKGEMANEVDEWL